ncbi:MAG: hypothetical protein ACOYXY_09075, partial [Thermodesulfobacteriota bacterium]
PPPSSSHQGRGFVKPSPLVGQAFQPAGGLERPPHKERRQTGTQDSFKDAELNTALLERDMTLL